MQLVNTTNGAVLANHIEVAANFKKRLQGLIGRSGLSHGEAFILLPCNSIHTCFMSFSIDILFVNKESEVLLALEKMKPFRFSPVIPHSYMVVEIPEGCIAATGTKAGHRLQLIVKEAVS